MSSRKPPKKPPAAARVDHYTREVALEAARQGSLLEEKVKGWFDALGGEVRGIKSGVTDLGVKLQEVRDAVKGDEWGREEGLIKRVTRIEGQLRGSPEKPADGLFHRVAAVEVDIRGEGAANPGIGKRLENVETMQTRIFNRVLIYVVLASLAGGSLGATGSDLAKDAAGAAMRAIISDMGGAAASPAMADQK